MSDEQKTVDDVVEETLTSEEANATNEQASPTVDVEQLQRQLDAALSEAASMKDQYLRAEADMANLRRRVEKDVENAHKFGQEKLSKELLSLADNLERAILAAKDSDDIQSLQEGVEMTLKGLMDVFDKFDIKAIDPVGEPFDPQLHQAMSMVENESVEANTVISVMQKGYQLHNRLIRPAMVVVSKGSAPAKKIDETA